MAGSHEVRGSIPLGSTTDPRGARRRRRAPLFYFRRRRPCARVAAPGKPAYRAESVSDFGRRRGPAPIFLWGKPSESASPSGRKALSAIGAFPGRMMRSTAKSRRFREDAADNAERPSRGGPAERNGRAPSGSRRRRPSDTPPRCACRGGTASLCRRSWALCPIPCTCSAPRPCCRPRPAPSERPRSARIERRSAGGGRIGENAVARLAGVWWREWSIRVGGNGCFCSGASNGVRIARDRVALMARGDERAPSMRAARASRRPWAAPLLRLWRPLHKDGRQGPAGNDCATWGNTDDSAESARAPE